MGANVIQDALSVHQGRCRRLLLESRLSLFVPSRRLSEFSADAVSRLFGLPSDVFSADAECDLVRLPCEGRDTSYYLVHRWPVDKGMPECNAVYSKFTTEEQGDLPAGAILGVLHAYWRLDLLKSLWVRLGLEMPDYIHEDLRGLLGQSRACGKIGVCGQVPTSPLKMEHA